MRTTEGKHVGEHQGLMYYTLGQRQGLGIGGPGEPWFVADKDRVNNVLYVVQGHDHPALLKPMLNANDCSWIAGDMPATATTYAAKTRYRQRDAACRMAALENGCVVEFDEPQWAITPGQSVVIYERDVCLGGGIIQ